MSKVKLKIYYIDKNLLEHLYDKVDTKIPKKDKRPYWGTLIERSGMKFFVPLATPKYKHRSMQNMIDFRKLKSSTGELVGVMNLNNCIPIQDLSKVIPIRINSLPTRTQSDIKYQTTLRKQYNALRDNYVEHEKAIYKFIDYYYEKRLSQQVVDRCVDFKAIATYYKNLK